LTEKRLYAILNFIEEEMVMARTISIEIPREVAHIARMTPEELRRELAVYLFQQGKLSFGKAREVTGMTAWAFQQLLGSRSIPVHYDVEDYEQDLVTLKELGRI
jgi:predicted HTH domain antitoxin